MDIRLTDIEDKGIVAGKDTRQNRGQAGFILSRYVYLDNLYIIHRAIYLVQIYKIFAKFN